MSKTQFADTCADLELDLEPERATTMQLNITRLCNQACAHCHMDASPTRREMMSQSTLHACVRALERNTQIETVDITGGAPELHPGFAALVDAVVALGRRVVVRHNLTVTIDPHPLTGEAMTHLPNFFASRRVELIASLPCYLASNTDAQRGDGVHEKSIESLRRLNAVGYGAAGSSLTVDLVHNPVEACLPGNQRQLQEDYLAHLAEGYGVRFNRLLAMTNVPVNRFADQLESCGQLDDYSDLLRSTFNPSAARAVMCKSQVSVAPDGQLYDCDFNQAVGLRARVGFTIDHFDSAAFTRREIALGEHCFACLAGDGSGCHGAGLVENPRRERSGVAPVHAV